MPEEQGDDETEGECKVDYAALIYDREPQIFDLCSSQIPLGEYACPHQWQTCSAVPCGGIVEGDASAADTGCTFNNSLVLSACLYANEQEFFPWPCRKGYDYYTYGATDAYTDTTVIGSFGTWADIKEQAMAPGYNTSAYFVSSSPPITSAIGILL